MSRDKQIEEMAELLCSTCVETNEKDCEKFGGVCGICDATRLYNAGYRKVDSVTFMGGIVEQMRAEVARDIFEELKKVMIDEYRYPIIAELKNKYTEEAK